MKVPPLNTIFSVLTQRLAFKPSTVMKFNRRRNLDVAIHTCTKDLVYLSKAEIFLQCMTITTEHPETNIKQMTIKNKDS